MPLWLGKSYPAPQFLNTTCHILILGLFKFSNVSYKWRWYKTRPPVTFEDCQQASQSAGICRNWRTRHSVNPTYCAGGKSPPSESALAAQRRGVGHFGSAGGWRPARTTIWASEQQCFVTPGGFPPQPPSSNVKCHWASLLLPTRLPSENRSLPRLWCHLQHWRVEQHGGDASPSWISSFFFPAAQSRLCALSCLGNTSAIKRGSIHFYDFRIFLCVWLQVYVSVNLDWIWFFCWSIFCVLTAGKNSVSTNQTGGYLQYSSQIVLC